MTVKAASPDRATRLEHIPGIGPAMAADLRTLGIDAPGQLRTADPVALYLRLCRQTGTRHDPCVLDVFMAAHAFMAHGDSRPWWAHTPERKRLWPEVAGRLTSGQTPDAR